jgi:glycosyltransferase 2 family protein
MARSSKADRSTGVSPVGPGGILPAAAANLAFDGEQAAPGETPGVPTGKMPVLRLALRLLLAGAGLALFAWFVQRAGAGAIARAFTNLGWFAPVVLLPFGLVYLLDTLGWRLAFGDGGPPDVSFGTLARIRWAGESINTVLPSAYIGGEAVKVQLLHKLGVPRMHSASSVVAGKTAQVIAQVVFIAAGAVAGAANLPPQSPARAGMLTITVLATAVVALLFWLQRRGMFRTLAALLPVRALTNRAESLRQLDDRIFEFYRKDRRHFALSAGSYLGGWMADTLEILLVSHLLGMPIDFSQALAVEAFISVAKALGIFVPGALGVQESGIVFLCYLFGLPPALGISYAIIRRGREVVYAAIGGIFLYAGGFSFRKRIAPGGEEPV